MKRLACAALLACGCGRIGFDAISDAVGGDDPDAVMLGSFGPPQLVPVVNSAAAEDDPSMTGDKLEIYFVRGPAPLNGTIYMATRASPADMWATPTIVPISGVDTEATVRVSRDGLRLWVGSPRVGGIGNMDVWLSVRSMRSQQWSSIVNVPELSSGANDFASVEYASETHIVLTSNRNGTQDIFGAERVLPTDPWGPPQALASLNTTLSDQDAFPSDSGLELWFSSDRAGGVGGFDLYRATRGSLSEPFGNVAPVAELNSTSDDGDPWLSPDGRTMLFVSNRTGNDEIYQATR